jgi:hypothetical protein
VFAVVPRWRRTRGACVWQQSGDEWDVPAERSLIVNSIVGGLRHPKELTAAHGRNGGRGVSSTFDTEAMLVRRAGASAPSVHRTLAVSDHGKSRLAIT